MALWQGKSKRKRTGGRYVYAAKKRRSEIGRERIDTVIGEDTYQPIRVRGGNTKVRVLSGEHINVVDKEKNRCVKTKVLTVLENSANPNYVRRNIITKGAVVQTELGKAKITSRPGKDGTLNGVLLK